MKIMPTTYFIIFLILSIALHFIYPIKKIIFPPYTYSGYLLIVLGIVLNLWTDLLFKKYKTTVKPHKKPKKLITNGPFSASRHPMYLGMVLILLGVAIIHGTLITFIFPIIFVILMEILFIPVEENNIKRIFGKKYLNYKKKVRRWI